MTLPNAAAVQLLYDNMAALPSEKFGVINMLPFAGDTEQTRVIKRHVCESIVDLLDSYGYISQESTRNITPITLHEVSVKCSRCSNPLMMTMVDKDGVRVTEPRKFIADIATLNPECPHGVLTSEDHLRHMVDELQKGLMGDGD